METNLGQFNPSVPFVSSQVNAPFALIRLSPSSLSRVGTKSLAASPSGVLARLAVTGPLVFPFNFLQTKLGTGKK